MLKVVLNITTLANPLAREPNQIASSFFYANFSVIPVDICCMSRFLLDIYNKYV